MPEAVVADSKATRREWVGLAVIALPCVLCAMDLTVLNLAVPHLSADLKPTSAQLLWILDIYGFLVAGSLITMGTLGDRIGRRRLLLLGAAAFGVASVIAAYSRSAEMLIAARALLGVAGATIAPSTLSLIRNMFHDPHQRTFAIGVWVTSYSIGGAVGPLLELQLFRSRAFSAALVAYMLGTFAVFGAYVFIAQYLQLVLGLTPLKAGLWTLPSFSMFIAGSMIVPVLARRFPPTQLIGAGLVIAAIGLAVLTLLDRASPLAVIVTGSVIYSLGFTPVVILATDIIVGSAPVERAGSASAISETSSELGGALGVAILGSIGMAVYRAAMATALPSGIPSDATEIARGTLGGASAVAHRLGDPIGAELLSAARDAFTQAFVVTAAVNAVIVLATAIAATLALRHARNVRGAREPSAV